MAGNCMQSKCVLMALLMISITCGSAFTYGSEENTVTIKIAINEIPLVLENGRADFPYNKVLNALNEHVPFNIELSFRSTSRAAASFNNRKSACLFPGNLASNFFNSNLKIESDAINVAKAYFIGTEVIDAHQVLTNKDEKRIIGFVRGNSFGQQIRQLQHHSLVPLSSDSHSEKMLRRGRIDMILAYMPDFLDVLQLEDDLPLKYSEKSLFYTQEDNILCHSNEQTKEFVTAVNQQLTKMKKNGVLKELLGKAYLE